MNDNEKKSGFATTGLVLGIIGICTSYIPIINNLSFVLGVIGIIFAIIALMKKASKKTAIAALIICVLTCYFTIEAQEATSKALNEAFEGINDATGDNTETILENNCDVIIGDFNLTKGSYGFNESKLPVTVTNKTNEQKSFSIQIEAIKADGSRITTDYIYANNLNAGQSQSFDCFEYVSDDDYNAMKNATFKIVEVSMY